MKEKKDIIKLLAINEKDVGSTAVQIGLLSEKINKLGSGVEKSQQQNDYNTIIPLMIKNFILSFVNNQTKIIHL